MTDVEQHEQRAREDAVAAGAWEPSPGELARLLLHVERDADVVVSERGLSEWSFYRRGRDHAHVTICKATGHAYLTVLGPSRSVVWVTRADAMRVLGLVEDDVFPPFRPTYSLLG